MRRNDHFVLAGLSLIFSIMLLSAPVMLVMVQFPFSDGFESGNFNAWSTTYTTSGSAQVEAGNQYRGSYAAVFTTDAIADYTYASARADIPSQSIIYARGYFMLPSTNVLSASSDKIWLIVFTSSGQSLAWAGVTLDEAGNPIWQVMVRDGSTFRYEKAGSVVFGQYYSVELAWINNVSGYAKLYVDGGLVASASGDTSTVGDCTSVRFGVAEKAGGVFSAIVYVDDCEIDAQIIGPAQQIPEPDEPLPEKTDYSPLLSMFFVGSAVTLFAIGLKKRK